MNINETIAGRLGVKNWQVDAAVKLIDEGNTVPFIARYRKEATGTLNDEQLRSLSEQLTYLRSLEERREKVLRSIEEQGKLTAGLREQIEAAQTLVEVEDLYLPYRQKRRTRASIARERGLQRLADFILEQNTAEPVEKEAAGYVDAEGEVPDVMAALQGARDIIAEQISDNAQYRSWIREKTLKEGVILSSEKARKKAGSKEEKEEKTEVNKKLASRHSVYESYYDYEEQISRIPGHRVLALNRGEKEKFLSVKIEAPKDEILSYLLRQIESAAAERTSGAGQDAAKSGKTGAGETGKSGSENTGKSGAAGTGKSDAAKTVRKAANTRHFTSFDEAFRSTKAYERNANAAGRNEKPAGNIYTHPQLEMAVRDSYERLIAPAIEREVRGQLTENAQEGAIRVFASNLEQLLMQRPVSGKVVLGWDPAFRTGCKLAVVDPTGHVEDTRVIYPTAPQNKVTEAKAELQRLVDKYDVSVISVGNGTASRESEQVIIEFIKEQKKPLHYVIVNEAGASVYSASKLATEEFPNFDVGQRSAASIARRLQDPLAELVKIDPKAIGVGQYQHDMDQKKLDAALTGVVEKCVNSVGVDLNTASFSLLSYIAGISAAVAKNIVAYREKNGRFSSRKELLEVRGLGPKAFEQCAGFLRITGGTNPLDATSVHPESYKAVESLLRSMKLDMVPPSFREAAGRVRDVKKTAQELGIGEITLQDILDELKKPARDPREDMPAPVLRSDVLGMDDLKPGMKLRGTVRNIVDFGAFVDIGVHQDGLVHISKMSRRFIKHPLEVVHVGDVVDVTVLNVDAAKKRISLSMVD